MDCNNIYCKLLSGGISGFVEVSLTHPFDVFKIKLQQNNSLKNTINDINKTYKINGIPSLYRGYIPRLCGIIPMRTMFWGVQGITNDTLKNNEQYRINKQYCSILSGINGGIFQTLVDNPIEVLKIYNITGDKKNYFEILKKRYKLGLISTLSRNVIFAGFVGYGVTYYKSDDPYINFYNGAIWGLMGSVVSHPFDYVKTMQQKIYHDKDTMIKILKKTPNKTLMRGVIPRTTIAIFTMGIGSSIYNYLDSIL